MPEGSSGADIPTQALCALLCHYGRDEEDAPCLNKWNKEGREAGVVSRQEAIIQHSVKSILIWMFFSQCTRLSVYLSLVNLCHSVSILCLWFCPVFLLGFSCLLVLVSHLCLFLGSLVRPHLHFHHHPPHRYSCVHFVPLKFIELAQTAEMQKIREALSLLLSEKWYCTVDEWAVGLCVSVLEGEGSWCRGYRLRRNIKTQCFPISSKSDKDSARAV